MKGLMVKDLRLAFGQKRMWILSAVIGLILSISMQEATFIITYMLLMAVCIAATTIALDRQGMEFILTLPVSRTKYIVEKYLFAYLFGFSVMIAGGAVYGIFVLLGKSLGTNDILEAMAMMMLMVVVIPAIEIPTSIIFSAENGKLGFYIMVGLVVSLLGIITFVSNMISGEKAMGIMIENMVARVNSTPLPVLTALGVLALLLIMAVSFIISISVFKKKEF